MVRCRRIGPLSRQCGENVQADDVASIIYTSGTTGIPKGVMLTHRNIVTNVLDCAEVFDLSASDVTLSFLPLCHIFQRTVDYLMLHAGREHRLRRKLRDGAAEHAGSASDGREQRPAIFREDVCAHQRRHKVEPAEEAES